MKELLELKEKIESEITKMEKIVDTEDSEFNDAIKIRLIDRKDFLKLIEIIYHLK